MATAKSTGTKSRTTTSTSTKTAAKATKTQAAATAAQAKETSVEAQRTLRALVTDGVYAAVGATDNAVELLRALPTKVRDLRADVPAFDELPKEVQQRLLALRAEAAKEFDALAVRGRTVLGTIASSPVTQRAVEQTRVARSQVKGAVTSVRRAVDSTASAAGSAAGEVGEDR